ncbi:hypothetical protein SAMN05428989_3396 [Pseudoxanthomonas sp. GM95]|uniref:hypothetical protein n=1 Tax=Pseudoxanthomonas sp. GM95 TaxID=1881043 RepID=UPI0008BD23CC|nr:hypothetical protein [Pseudoxanthomonas sp. GM95]SEM21813.1 hypothetical protein SAMN05428989_3396 [Pseudoxanthomonas sp. GM95]
MESKIKNQDELQSGTGIKTQNPLGGEPSTLTSLVPKNKNLNVSKAALAVAKAALNFDLGFRINAINPEIRFPTSQISNPAESLSQRITKKLFFEFSKASHENLAYGERFEVIDRALHQSSDSQLANLKNSREKLEALDAVLQTHSKYVTSEVKSAALRYLSLISDDLDLSRVTQILSSSLIMGAKQQQIAAAHTLGEIGDIGAIAVLKNSLKFSESKEAQKAIENAINAIGEAHGIGKITDEKHTL